MTQRNALMELIEQARRLAKHSDMMILNKIDYMFKYLWLLDISKIKQYREILEPIIKYYHKPNLFDIIKTKSSIEEFFKSRHDGTGILEHATNIVKSGHEDCIARTDFKKCKLCGVLMDSITDIFQACLNQYKKDKESLDILICEIVDFMHERPELVNINLIDDYMRTLIEETCNAKNKINPLSTELVERFGKFWRDKSGNWQHEKRRRY